MSKQNIYLAGGAPLPGNTAIKATGRTRTGAIVASAHAAVADNGEINATSRKDALAIIANLLEASRTGAITAHQVEEPITAAKRNAVHAGLIQAFQDTNGPAFAVYGEQIANTVRDTNVRAGILRRFLPERELGTQEIAKTRLRRHRVNCMALGPNSTAVESRHDGRFMFPEEQTLSARPIINEKDLYQEGMGLLDEKAEEALESLMVGEDRGLRALFDAAVSKTGQQLAFPTFTPTVFATLKQMVENTGGLPVNDAWMSNDLWVDINSGSGDFPDWFDPISKHDLVLTGKVGTMMECSIHTDAHLESRLRVLKPGELYFVARADFLGETLLRQAVTSSEISGANEGQAWRVWFIRQILAISLSNIHGVSKGFKM